LLLDEPLTGLGQDLKIKIIGEIDRFTRDNKPVIVWATHEEVEGLNAMKYQQTKQ
jgi:ABC-type sugar transport system ATPase subunit